MEGMPVENAGAWLTAWEAAKLQAPPQRALTLLETAWPVVSQSRWMQLSLGARDRYLLKVRQELFGSTFDAVATCPKCGERLETSFGIGDVLSAPAAHSEPTAELRVSSEGYDVVCRLPNSADLLTLRQCSGENGIRDERLALLQRCISSVRHGADCIGVTQLPDEVVEAVSRRMADADPDADVRVDFQCPECGNKASIQFDIISYLWSEIEAWMRGILFEVHALASAYGWSESEILGLTPRRRRMYLEMLGVYA
jgi:hypothetical protein